MKSLRRVQRTHWFGLAILVGVGLLAAAGCGNDPQAEQPADTRDEGKAVSMKLTSTAFAEGAPIPKKHTGEGADVSPPLEWTGAPAAAKSFALICDDPDAPRGTWVHWVMYNIPADARGLPEHVPANEALPDGSRQGQNDFRVTGYRGPMPPPGKAHRYYFKLYALDFTLELPKSATKADLEKAMKGHVLAEGSLMGTYRR